MEGSIMGKKAITPNQKHLTLEDREYIEEALKRNLTFKEIARYLSKDPTTISKEVKKRRTPQKPSGFNNSHNQCELKQTCKKQDLCNTGKCRYPCRQCQNCNLICADFKKKSCSKTLKAPFVCNGCEKKTVCRLEKQYYRAAPSQRTYRETLVCAREGVNLTSSEFDELDCLISPLVKRGQSIAHICAAHKDEIPCTERTIYNYFEQNLFTVANIDLPRKVRYKKRKSNVKKEPCDYAVREGRTYQDFLMFTAENPELSVVEMDTVAGRSGGKVLLTMLIRSCRLQLAFLMEDPTQKSVKACFESLYETLGAELFSTVFTVILTDNGSEFLDPGSLENHDGCLRTRIFFCDPNCSYQKGMLEKNHEYIRYILPKGSSFDSLMPEDVRLMLNHINSASRDSLNAKTPLDAAEFLLPPGFLPAMAYGKIQPDEILLKPQLLR
jgi:transposase, IS30 family